MTDFETLKSKYNSVLRVMEQQGVRLQNLHMQDDKLFIRGEAPSPDAKSIVWNQIKLVDPTYSDLTADISIAPGAQAAAAQAAGEKSARSAEQTYTVQSGDTLSKIAREFYGDANQYTKIFNANRDQLNDPNKIRPGQVLKIPQD